MKRCIKWLTNWLSEWFGDLYMEQSVKCIIILGIILPIVIYTHIDTDPATPFDYERLENQVNLIWQKQELLTQTDENLDIDIKINTDGENIVVTFENSKCKVIEKYDKNFKLVSVSKEDKSMFWVWALICSLVLGIVLTCAIGLVILIVVRYFLCGYSSDDILNELDENFQKDEKTQN